MATVTSTNLLGVMQQLKDAQERAKKAEARASHMEAENERLQQELRRAQLERISTSVSAYASNDDLIVELQNQLAAAVNRNTQLELQMHEMNMARMGAAPPGAGTGSSPISLTTAGSPSRKHLL